MANLNYNLAVIGGKLTRDIELKKTNSGKSVCQFTVAINRPSVNKDGEQKADFIDCVAWNNTAEFISKFFHRGSGIVVTGKLQKRSWTDKDGNDRYTTEIIADRADFVDSKYESPKIEIEEDRPHISDERAEERNQPQEDLPF